MEKKRFFEAFPGVRVPEEAEILLRETNVAKVTYKKSEQLLLVVLESDHLISRQILDEAEESISRYTFGERGTAKTKIREVFTLSDAYTVSSVLDMYGESFFYEMQKEEPVAAILMKTANMTAEGNTITITLRESELARDRGEMIREWFRNVYRDRFHLTADVVISYADTKSEAKEKKILEELAGISLPVKNAEEPETPSEAMLAAQRKEEAENKMIESLKGDTNEVEITSFVMDKKPEKKVDFKANAEKFRRRYAQDISCFYGKNTEGDLVPISSLEDIPTEVVIRGLLTKLEEKETRKGKIILIGTITDFTDTITFKIFIAAEDKDPIKEKLHEGGFYRIKGVPKNDDYAKTLVLQSVQGIKEISDFRSIRMDNAEKKRVELHLHTMMSENDSVLSVDKLLKRCKDWGMNSVAITDHGVVQGFTLAMKWMHEHLSKDDPFKIIHGVEGYLVDDRKDLVLNGKGQSLDSDYVIFDIETTGLSAKFCKIIEIGAVRIDANGKELGRFSEFVNPEVPIPYNITQLTSITDGMVINAPTIEVILPKFLEFAKGAILVAHNAQFDTGFIREFAGRLGLPYDFTALDTMTLGHVFVPDLGRYTLDRLGNHFKIKNKHHHRACDDADATALIFMELMKLARKAGCETLKDLNKVGAASESFIKKAKAFHGTIIAKNETGRVNLYRLISASHIQYFNDKPKIPMSLIEKYRDGLLLGSACASGELYQAILDGKQDDEIARIVSFFDYLEIMPIGNNLSMIASDKVAAVNSEEDLREITRKIIKLGKEFGKPVVATGDVHFLDPEDAIYRQIVEEGTQKPGVMERILKKNPKGMEQPPLYLRTTEEMLEEFSWLGKDLAEEVVVTNTNLIADMVEKISPVRPDKCPPVIENSDKILRDICESRAHEIYGPNLPEIVSDRLERELHSIISNGYSVMYVIAQKLVHKSNADGYLVGSRGSVGSSFAATMAGITEVNPLPPHYICPACFYSEFDSERVKQYSGTSGCDMPDAVCPKCGKPMVKEGHDIPFETFLGFKGDKEPDIDLNFSGDYQPRAHAYIEEIFGKECAFRAGTIGTLAEKTAYGYVLKYCENHNITMRHEEVERLAAGCTGVKRTTGQHPGGIIVMPNTEEIHSFTPVQKPANDMTVDTVTTHFDYHSIEQNLLKFDILGHDDPTMIRRLEDLTGTDARKVPLDDKKVMSLFHGTEALGITPEDIGGTKLGALGVPEFGTDFAMQMVMDANPENFSDLVRIAGLAHGTDVWLGNAQTLIEEGKCKLSSAICCRDDIMVYLIHMGLEPGKAFNIMEKVRKGAVAKGKVKEWDEWSADMEAHGVPDWYIWSCTKIKYMFPKAHAVAYVMMAWRIAWYKLNYPQAYYAAYFGIRADAFNYELMCLGRERLEARMAEYKAMEKHEMSAKDQDTMKVMRIVQEMYARGFEFLPIDIYRSDASKFEVVDGKILPALSSIEGMGEKAAQQLAEAAKDGPFISLKDLKDRAKLSGTLIDKMVALGLIEDLPEDNQFSFNFLSE